MIAADGSVPLGMTANDGTTGCVLARSDAEHERLDHTGDAPGPPGAWPRWDIRSPDHGYEQSVARFPKTGAERPWRRNSEGGCFEARVSEIAKQEADVFKAK